MVFSFSNKVRSAALRGVNALKQGDLKLGSVVLRSGARFSEGVAPTNF